MKPKLIFKSSFEPKRSFWVFPYVLYTRLTNKEKETENGSHNQGRVNASRLCREIRRHFKRPKSKRMRLIAAIFPDSRTGRYCHYLSA